MTQLGPSFRRAASAAESWREPLHRALSELGASGADLTSPRQRESMVQEALCRVLAGGQPGSWAEFRRIVEAMAEPSVIDEQWDLRRAGKKSFLMICHDQRIDRRILQQASTLAQAGWVGKVVAMSADGADHLEQGSGFGVQGSDAGISLNPEPRTLNPPVVSIHRVGLLRIVPDCPVYWSYQKRQRLILPTGALRRVLSAANWALFRLHMKACYGRQRQIDHPLPYDLAFRAAGSYYRADVVVAHDLTALPAGQRLAEAWGVPLVYDAHELYEEQVAFSPNQRRMLRRVERELLSHCDLAFTVNDSIADEMQHRYGRRPVVLPNAVDAPADFDPAARHDRLRRHFGIPDDVPVLIYQGGLLPGRNIEALVEAVGLVGDRPLALALVGGGPLRGDIERLISRNGLRDRVFLKTDVDWSDIAQWTASADVGIIPYPDADLNARYCTPNKLYEYVQAGVPILANDLPELRRHVRDTGFGLTAAMPDASAIAAAIVEMLSDAQRLRQMRAAILSRRDESSWRRASEDYLRQLDRLISSGGSVDSARSVKVLVDGDIPNGVCASLQRD
jgi:glycosyltransferase involved in cell wall biosynthesis